MGEKRSKQNNMESGKKLQVSVVGGRSEVAPEFLALARELGGAIASKGAILVCGGLGGIMEAAARGAKERSGLTVGIIPEYDKETANPFIDIVIPSGLGHARNILVAASGDIIVAFPGSHGTRSEISIALKLSRPVLGMRDWGAIPGVRQIDGVTEFESALAALFLGSK